MATSERDIVLLNGDMVEDVLSDDFVISNVWIDTKAGLGYLKHLTVC